MFNFFLAFWGNPNPDGIKEVGPNLMNISGYFSKHEISEELIIPFASSKPAILMVAGSDDQLCPSVYFVSAVQVFWKYSCRGN